MDEKHNHPTHYNTGQRCPSGDDPLEVWNFIKAHKLSFDLGNVIKYIVRADQKHESPMKDLLKAREYLDHHIRWVEHNLQKPSKKKDKRTKQIFQM